MKIAFSITCHEELSCVVDQILNFNFFTKNAIFLIHVNLCSQDLFEEISRFDFSTLPLGASTVFLNPERFDTGKSCFTLHKAHLSNLKLLRNKGIDFDYFILEASNSLFIKPGFQDHIINYTVGMGRSEYDISWKDKMLSHATVKDFCREKISESFDLKDHNLKSIHEGTFYRGDIIDDVFCLVSELDSLCSERSDFPNYPTEELWFSICLYIVSNRKIVNFTNSLTYLPWHRNLKWSLDDTISAINGVGIPNDKFLIKRVERKFDDEIRSYIRNKFGY